MSKSASGRTYADFFPAAPSVLQKKKAQIRHKPTAEASAEADGSASDDLGAPSVPDVRHGLPQPVTRDRDRNITQDDRNSPSRDPGDLLNGVGSASSLASTGSSVFSRAGRSTMKGSHCAGAHSFDLTPLTNHELSPTEEAFTPHPKADVNSQHVNGFIHTDEAVKVSECASATITPIFTPPHITMSARPGPGMAKGQKVIYDPELDAKLAAKDRKKLKPRFKDFGADESSFVPPDPRLAIPGYRAGNFELRSLTGEAKLWKCKPRLAPYTVTPYQWDPSISVGSGPPSSIVIIGFDPFTPDSQIRALFGSYGEIAELENKTDPHTGTFLGICAIRYRDSRPRHGQSISASNAARKAEKEGHKQRIGTAVIRVERDQGGRKCRRYVERVSQRNQERQYRERPSTPARMSRPMESEAPIPLATPPLNAPKGPSGKPPTIAKLPEPSRPVTLPNSYFLVEQDLILPKMKRKPYIFIPHKSVPVMHTTIPHLQKRLKMFRWEHVRCDQTGYFIIFDDSKRGEDEAVRCYREMDGKAMFTYELEMECQQYGDPNYERSPTPERVLIEKRKRKEIDQARKDEELDIEEEKKQRALNLDPVLAAVELLRTELKDKIMSDIKTRIAAPALYEFLDPARHVEMRRKLGISDPAEQQQKPAPFLAVGDELPAGKHNLQRGGPSGNFRKDLLSSRLGTSRTAREDLSRGSGNAFADERRQKRPARKVDVRSLHQRLQDLYGVEEESDDERATMTRESQERESRPLSRRSSIAPTIDRDDDFVFSPRKRRRIEREATPGDESGDEQARADLGQELLSKEPEDMSLQELKAVLQCLPSTAKLHQRAKAEVRLRVKAKEDDRLFIVEPQCKDDPAVFTDDNLPEVMESTEAVLAKSKKRSKAKKKSKKQIFEEREAAKAEALQRTSEIPTPEASLMEEESFEERKKVEEEEEPRAEVEWGVSTEAPKRTVQDEPDIVLDVDGWQHLVKDSEDLDFLRLALIDESTAELGNANTWVYQQKKIKALNSAGAYGVSRDQTGIKGYYVSNETGSARTEGVKKILESEKSKYLPHRIKVAKARERREAEAEGKDNSAVVAEAARLAKLASNAASRSNRASNRTHVKDINTVKQNLSTDGQQGDAIRFNQLKKRKKLVKFDRSAIHGWGLYAEENIAMSDMIIEYVGEKVRQAVANVRELRYDKQGLGSSYLFRIDEDSVVDATKKGGIARFVNHSCAPNCTAKIIRVDGTKRIVIYALKEIAKNEELTYDYKFDREMDNDDRIPCLCGSDVCKGFLN